MNKSWFLIMVQTKEIDITTFYPSSNADLESSRAGNDNIEDGLDNPVYPVYEEEDVGEPQYEEVTHKQTKRGEDSTQ